MSRTIDHTTPSRGMSAFDFDETLINKGKNFVIAKRGDEEIKINKPNCDAECIDNIRG